MRSVNYVKVVLRLDQFTLQVTFSVRFVLFTYSTTYMAHGLSFKMNWIFTSELRILTVQRLNSYSSDAAESFVWERHADEVIRLEKCVQCPYDLTHYDMQEIYSALSVFGLIQASRKFSRFSIQKQKTIYFSIFFK